MKAKIILLLSIIVLSGCLATNPDKALRTISQWIPPGTSQEDAILTMKQHGYEGGPCGRDGRQPQGLETVFCFWHTTKILENSRYFFVHFINGKVVSIDGWRTGNDYLDSLGHVDPSGK